MNATTNYAGAVMAEWADSEGWRSTYVLGDTALQYSKSLGAYFTTRFKEQGGQVVGTDTWNYFKDTQFGAQVTRYLALPTKPDFIFMPGGVPTLASLVRQFRAAGINTPILCADACDGQVLTQTAGPISDLYFDTVACVPSYCNSNPANAKLVKFVADFTTMWSEAPATAYAVIGYDTIQVIAAAMKAANSTDGKAMLDQLNKLSVDGLGGKYTFTSTTHYPVNKPESIIQVQNGTFSLVSIYTPKSVPAP